MTTLSTGFEGFDECLDGGVHSDGLVVISGPPACGKTAFARFLLKQALRKGLQAHLIDLENTAESTIKAVGEERQFTFQTLWDDVTAYKMVEEKDLLIVDNLSLAYSPAVNQEGNPLGGIARWMGEVTRKLESIPWEKKRAVRVITVQGPRDPERLTQATSMEASASVVFKMSRVTNGATSIWLTKNRYGTTSGPVEFKVPEFAPFVRRTIWERLLEA